MSGRRQYPFHLIEPKWQQHWDKQQTFRAFNPGEVIPENHPFAQRHSADAMTAGKAPAKYYILDMFPYPSGAGLHVGHPEGYTATDILARYRRAQGRHVLHPMGWDAFGLPAEQYAIKTGQHPRKTTEANIATFKRQIKSLGFSYDWTREVDTTDPHYFKWTQWIFLKLYNSYFDPEWNKAMPVELLEDALSDSPKRRNEWQANAFLVGTHEGFLSLKEDARSQARKAFIANNRLAFVMEAPVWWCEQLGTVLANEEVVDGKSEVGGFPVVRKPMRQWMLRITKYAERLLSDLNTIDWTDSLKEMQRNWIGKSEGAEVDFQIADSGTGVSPVSSKTDQSDPESHGRDARATIRVFTTRPDTLFGATYMVLSPEHKLVAQITTPEQKKAVEDYKTFASSKSDLERTELAKEKTGVFTGAHAINPVTNEKIPIWIADYVLATYGTGAIMAVPAHDERDFEFAKSRKLPIKPVVGSVEPFSSSSFDRSVGYQIPNRKEQLIKFGSEDIWIFTSTDDCFVGEGVAVNSTSAEFSLNGLSTSEAKTKITAWLESKGLGKRTINYKLRDWLFSRQRYWGEPFPIIWKRDAEGNLYHEALPESALPLLPPKLDDYKPTPDGQPPLARAQDWVNLPDGSTRETNTMPQWAGSCWYYLRYLDAKNPNTFVSKEAENYWMGGDIAKRVTNRLLDEQGSTPGVDLYVGGTEHAVLHLLYARFWHKVLFDLGYVSIPEPFFKLVNQGLILGEMEYLRFEVDDTTGKVADVSATELINITPMSAGKAKAAAYHKNDPKGKVVMGYPISEGDVVRVEGGFALKSNPNIRVHTQCFKMSKSRGNVVNPDDILAEYGADAFRLYEMFMGPLEMSKPWNTKGVEGVYRFLGRVWRVFIDEQSETEFEQAETTADAQKRGELLNVLKLNQSIKDVPATPAQLKLLHATIKKVTEDLDGMRFNTAISAMMVFVNEAMTWETKPVSVLRDFLILLAPFAPHVTEELWTKLGSSFVIRHSSLSYAEWPKYDPALLVEDTLEIPVQVNGKLRDVIKASANADNATLEAAAKASEKVQQFLEGKTIKKIIVVPKKLINIVAT